MPNILQVPVPVQNAALIWPTRQSSVNSLLFINQDLNNTIWIGQQSFITAGGQNTIPIPPNGTFSGDASSPWYVIGSVAGTQPLVVVPNGQAYFLGLTQGLGNLAIPSVRSPNFVAGSTGWQIGKDGSAEFNNGAFRGTLIDNQFFIYDPSPGPGKLVKSITDENLSPFNDRYGNPVIPGDTSYKPGVSAVNITGTGGTSFFWWTGAAWAVASQQFLGGVFFNGHGGIFYGPWNAGGQAIVIPSGDTSGATDTNNLNGALAGTSDVRLLSGAGIYYINGTISIPTNGTLKGAGNAATIIKCVGSGDFIRVTTGGNFNLGSVTGLTLDGASTTGASTGIHIGDGVQGKLDCIIQNFSRAGSIGLHLDNTVTWTEQVHGTVHLANCASHAVFDVNANGFNSFARTNLDLTINAAAGQDGVVVQNGAFLYDAALSIRGNFASSSTTPMSTAALRITGQAPVGDPNASGFTVIRSSRIDIGVECTAGAFTPSTIIFGTPGSNGLSGCYGVMDFSVNNSPFTLSNYISTNANTFGYFGPVMGDTNLSPGNGNGVYSTLTSEALQYNKSNFNGSNGNIYLASGDFFSNPLSANITITPQGPFVTGPQRKTIRIIQAPVGSGPFTVAWPHNAVPTPAAPKFRWPGGTAPTMTAAADAVDLYYLETFDGSTWDCRASQNVS